MSRMKKVALFMYMVFASSWILSGCNQVKIENKIEDKKEFFIDYYNITFTTSKEWSKTDQNNFDLQITNGDSYFSVMTYYVIDLPVGDTAESIYAWQNEDLFSRREHVEVVDEEQVIKGNGRTITTTLFSAERDNKKNYYYSCLVQLDENEEVFAWVIVTAMPSYMMQNQDEFIEMMKTMEYIEEKETLPENVI